MLAEFSTQNEISFSVILQVFFIFYKNCRELSTKILNKIIFCIGYLKMINSLVFVKLKKMSNEIFKLNWFFSINTQIATIKKVIMSVLTNIRKN